MTKKELKFAFVLYFLITSLGTLNTWAEEINIYTALDYEICVRRATDDDYDFKGDVINLWADISPETTRFPLFNGTFDGHGHTLTLKNCFTTNLGPDGVIKDLTIDGSTVGNKNSFGIFATECSGTILRCVNNRSIKYITSNEYIICGGFVGNLYETGVIAMCVNNGDIYTTSIDEERVYFPRSGGIAGHSKGKIQGCTNNGNITSQSYSTMTCGGIVGEMASEGAMVSGCVNNGKINTTLTGEDITSTMVYQRTGGIVGYATNGRLIENCANYGSVTNNMDYVAGIVAYCNYADIINCQNHAEIKSVEKFFYSNASGICASYYGREGNSNIFNCLNTGDITSNTSYSFSASVAGICGGSALLNVSNCLNFGKLAAQGRTVFKAEIATLTGTSKLIYQPANVGEAKTYANNNNSDSSKPLFTAWTGSGTGTRLRQLQYAVVPTQGALRFYLDDSRLASKIEMKRGGQNEVFTVASSDIVTAPSLSPDTQYNYAILTSSGELLARAEISTKPVVYNLQIDKVKYWSIDVSSNLITEDMEEVGLIYKLGDGETGEWTSYQPAPEGPTHIDGLKEGHLYHLVAHATWTDGHGESDPIRFETKFLMPEYELVETKLNSVEFVCTNLADLEEEGVIFYGIAYYYYKGSKEDYKNAKYIYSDGSDRLLIEDIATYAPPAYDSYGYRFLSFIEVDDEVKTLQFLDALKLPRGVEKPMYVSPNAFRVRGTVDKSYDVSLKCTGPGSTEILELRKEYYTAHALVTYDTPGDYIIQLQGYDYNYGKDLLKTLVFSTTESMNCKQVPPEILVTMKDYTEFIANVMIGEGEWTYKMHVRDLFSNEVRTYDAILKKKDKSTNRYVSSSIPYLPDGLYQVYFTASDGDMTIYNMALLYDGTKGIGPSQIEWLPSEEQAGILYGPLKVYNLHGVFMGTYDTEGSVKEALTSGVYLIVDAQGHAKKVIL